MDLLHLASTKDHCANVGVLRSPGKCELARRGSKLFGDRGELLDLLDLCLTLIALQLLNSLLEELLVGREARVLWDALVLLADQQTRGKRRPDGGTVLELLV